MIPSRRQTPVNSDIMFKFKFLQPLSSIDLKRFSPAPFLDKRVQVLQNKFGQVHLHRQCQTQAALQQCLRHLIQNSSGLTESLLTGAQKNHNMSAAASTSAPCRSMQISHKPVAATTKSLSQPCPKRAKPTGKPLPHSLQTLYLRINRRFLQVLSTPTENQPNPEPSTPPPGTTGNLNVIAADILELHPFMGTTVDWLIKIARFIFEPLGTSSLYTFTTESLEWWMNREMELSTWRQVAHGEQLEATIYEFQPNNGVLVSPTKMSLRQVRSVTTNTLESPSQATAATLFRRDLVQHHGVCVITQHQLEEDLIASHLIPRRLGDAGVQFVTQRFTGSSTIVDRYDPLIGVPLVPNLNQLADRYQLGFWNNGHVSLLTFILNYINIFVC